MALGFTEVVTIELTKVLSPLRRLRTAEAVARFVRELGWDFGGELDVDLGSLADLIDALVAASLRIADADTEDEALEVVGNLAAELPRIFERLNDGIPRIEAALRAAPDLAGEVDELAALLSKRFSDRLLYDYLETYRSGLFGVLHLLGLVDVVRDESGASVRTIHWDRIPLLFSDPMELARRAYGWNTEAGMSGDLLLGRFERVTRAFMLPGGIYRQLPAIHQALGRPASDQRELRMPVFQWGGWPDKYVEFDLNISPVPASDAQSKDGGVALYPYLHGDLAVEQGLGEGWKLGLRGTADVSGGMGVTLRAPHRLEMTRSLFSGRAPGTTDARLELSISNAKPNGELTLLFGDTDSTHLGFLETSARGVFALEDKREELGVEFEVLGLTLKLGSEEADSFLDKLLGGVQVETRCDIALGYSNLDGVYFGGSGGLEVEIPLRRQLGPIFVESVLVALEIAEGLAATFAASFSAELGPISATVQGIGLRIPISFPSDQSGNLGPVQIDKPAFKPPTGAGLALSAGPLTGGGFLDFDHDNQRYSGILALQVAEISIVAIGLITTKLPDGKKGFSMLVNLGVTFDPPVQLALGFTLSGVGGLVGINRSMNIEVLQRGVKQRTLDSILFPDPEKVVADASKIISDMRAVFPPSEGRFVIGPMVKLGWGTPNIITADIGIFLELPEPVRVALMGQLRALLPQAKAPLVVINLDVLGVLDLEKKELTFQASLYDSRILAYPMAGDSAFLLNWGSQSQFALSMGGFHPRFPPPPPPIIFADLRRLSLSISAGKKLKLSCRAYQAITPNSVQFGARLDPRASAMGAKIKGHMGFDALFYLSPFSFEVSISAGVSIRFKGVSLADVRLSFRLSGPTPWKARGKARVKIAFLPAVKVRFCIKWGSGKKRSLPPVDPWKTLTDTLANAECWGTILPAGRGLVETLRPLDKETERQLVVHPVGRLEVRQNVVPLRMTLSKAGNAPIAGHDRFEMRSLKVGSEELASRPVKELFARGQFQSLSHAKKLSVPGFERFQAGLTTAASEAVRISGDTAEGSLRYESIVIEPNLTTTRAKKTGELDWEDAEIMVAMGAKRRAQKRAGRRERFAPTGKATKVAVQDESYAIVEAESLQRAELDASIEEENADLSRVEAEQVLAQHSALHPRGAAKLIIVSEYEIEEEAA